MTPRLSNCGQRNVTKRPEASTCCKKFLSVLTSEPFLLERLRDCSQKQLRLERQRVPRSQTSIEAVKRGWDPAEKKKSKVAFCSQIPKHYHLYIQSFSLGISGDPRGSRTGGHTARCRSCSKSCHEVECCATSVVTMLVMRWSILCQMGPCSEGTHSKENTLDSQSHF